MKKLKEYFPYLIGCKIKIEKEWIYDTDGFVQVAVKAPVVIFAGELLCKAEQSLIEFKPILKPLASMTTRDRFEMDVYMHRTEKDINEDLDYTVRINAIATKWYLQNSFDIFDLIGKDLAIDATVTPEPKPKLTYEKD